MIDPMAYLPTVSCPIKGPRLWHEVIIFSTEANHHLHLLVPTGVGFVLDLCPGTGRLMRGETGASGRMACLPSQEC